VVTAVEAIIIFSPQWPCGRAGGTSSVQLDQPINRDLGVAILLVEQNARAALSVASYGYIIEQGKSGARRLGLRLARMRTSRSSTSAGRRPAQELQEPEKFQTAEAMALSADFRIMQATFSTKLSGRSTIRRSVKGYFDAADARQSPGIRPLTIGV
jgi:hypothetical protein